MITPQRFKENDVTETKMIAVAMPSLDTLGADHDAFFNGAYTAHGLGDVLWELGRDPMSGVLTKETFRLAFAAIHQLFTRPGTFEFYLEVFRAIWGENVAITFGVPIPGVLTINAETLDLENFNFIAREIVNNDYVFHNMRTEAGDDLIFRDTVGIKTQNEITAFMNEISPQGVFVITTLTL